MATKNYVPLRFKGDDKVLYVHEDDASRADIQALKQKFDEIYKKDGSRYEQEKLALEITDLMKAEKLKSPIVAVKSIEKSGETDVSKWNFLVEEVGKGSTLSISLDDGDLGRIEGKQYLPPAALPDEMGDVNVIESKNRDFIHVAAQAYKLVPDLDLDFGSEERTKFVEYNVNQGVISFIKGIKQDDAYDAAKAHHALRDAISEGVSLRTKPTPSVDFDAHDPSKFQDGMKSYLKNYISFGGGEITYLPDCTVKMNTSKEEVDLVVGVCGEDGSIVLKVDNPGNNGDFLKVDDVLHLKVKGGRGVPERPLLSNDLEGVDVTKQLEYLSKLINSSSKLPGNSLLIRRENEAALNEGYVDAIEGFAFINKNINADEQARTVEGPDVELSGVKLTGNSMIGVVDRVKLDSVDFDFMKEAEGLHTKQGEDAFFAANKDGIKLESVARVDRNNSFEQICMGMVLYGALGKHGVAYPSFEGKPSYATEGIIFSMTKDVGAKYSLKYNSSGELGGFYDENPVNKVELFVPSGDDNGRGELKESIVKTNSEGEFAFAERLKKSLSSGEYHILVNDQDEGKVKPKSQGRAR